MGNEFIFWVSLFFLFWDLQLDKDAFGYFIEILCALSRRRRHRRCLCLCVPHLPQFRTAQGQGKLRAGCLVPRNAAAHDHKTQKCGALKIQPKNRWANYLADGRGRRKRQGEREVAKMRVKCNCSEISIKCSRQNERLRQRTRARPRTAAAQDGRKNKNSRKQNTKNQNEKEGEKKRSEPKRKPEAISAFD